jgi:hypothetical protein
MFGGTIEEIAADAEKLLSRIAPGAVCVPQEWDNRIDCILELPDGSVVGEMVPLSQLTEKRVRQSGDRLRKRREGMEVKLIDELHPPVRIVPSPQR